MDAKELIKRARLRGEDTKQRVTVYVDSELYKQFKKACGSATFSHVIEEFMKDFVASAQSEAPPAPKKGGK